MKFGVREICDVVLRAKAAQKIGNKVFYKNEPVLYFDSLKTSSMEGAATTVYAQGGRGNARLIAWEGERTVTFTMEDALISPAGFSILTGAGLTQASNSNKMYVHRTEQTNDFKLLNETAAALADGSDATKVEIKLSKKPFIDSTKKNNEDFIYVMLLDDNGEICSEPYIAIEESSYSEDDNNKYTITILKDETSAKTKSDDGWKSDSATNSNDRYRKNDIAQFAKASAVLVDYYTEETSKVFEINITPDKFGGNFYLEASTLFRSTNGVDMPAEFIIPNCKIQSNFTFTMASSGDPSTFTFTMDAFPDYTRWNPTEKVFATIQVIEDNDTLAGFERLGTGHDYNKAATGNNHGDPYATYLTTQKPTIDPKGKE